MRRYIPPAVVPLIIFLPLVLAPLLGIGVRPHEAQRDLALAGGVIQAGGSPEKATAAARAVERVAWRNPWRGDLWELAGHLALRGGDLQTAIACFGRAGSAGSLSPGGRLALGLAHQRAGDLEAAIREWETLRTRQELPEQALPLLVEAHRTLGDIPAEIAGWQSIITLNPVDAAAHQRLGLLLAASDPLAAPAHLVQAGELDPALQATTAELVRTIRTASLQDDPAYLLLEAGRALAARGDWTLAEVAFQNAIAARPDYADAWAFQGEALQRNGRSAVDALSALERAVALDPASLAANSLMALYWQRRGDYQATIGYLRQAIRYHPGNPALLVDLADALAMTADLPGGLQAHRQALASAPADPAFYRLLAEYCLRYGYQVRETALPVARQAVLLNDRDPASLDVMAQVLVHLDDLYSAERYLLRALQFDSRYAPAYQHLGLVYILQGHPQAARQAWEQAVRLAPGSLAADQSARLLQNYFP